MAWCTHTIQTQNWPHCEEAWSVKRTRPLSAKNMWTPNSLNDVSFQWWWDCIFLFSFWTMPSISRFILIKSNILMSELRNGNVSFNWKLNTEWSLEREERFAHHVSNEIVTRDFGAQVRFLGRMRKDLSWCSIMATASRCSKQAKRDGNIEPMETASLNCKLKTFAKKSVAAQRPQTLKQTWNSAVQRVDFLIILQHCSVFLSKC